MDNQKVQPGPGGGPIFIGPQMLLPSDRVRHVGEAVALC
jgi:hypothetical protein